MKRILMKISKWRDENDLAFELILLIVVLLILIAMVMGHSIKVENDVDKYKTLYKEYQKSFENCEIRYRLLEQDIDGVHEHCTGK